MTVPSLLRHIDRDTRRQARIAAGSGMARYLPERDPAALHWSGAHRYTFAAKPAGTAIPEGCVVVAVRRDAHGISLPVLIEAFEGDRAAFAPFPRLALMLGVTELQIGLMDGTMLERIRAVDDLTNRHGFRPCSYGTLDRAALLSRPLAQAGAYDRSAIMATACAVAKARQGLTGEAWGVCLSAALRGVWTLARAARAAAAH